MEGRLADTVHFDLLKFLQAGALLLPKIFTVQQINLLATSPFFAQIARLGSSFPVFTVLGMWDIQLCLAKRRAEKEVPHIPAILHIYANNKI